MKKFLILILISFLTSCSNNNWHHKEPYYYLTYINKGYEKQIFKIKQEELETENFKDLKVYDKNYKFNNLNNFYAIKGPYKPLFSWAVYIYDYNDKKTWSLIKGGFLSKKEAEIFAKDIRNTIGFKTKIKYEKIN